MTKMLQTIQTGLKHKMLALLDVVIEMLVNFEDYIVFNRISLSECFFFIIASARAVWFTIFGAESQDISYYFSNIVWIAVFAATTVAHFAGFIFRRVRLRIFALYIHAVIWLFLAVLAVFSQTTAPAVPTFIPFLIFSLFLIVRLSRDRSTDASR